MSDSRSYVHAATSIQLSSWRHLFVFLRMSERVQKRLRQSPGYVKYGLRAKPFSATFQTYSIYEDYESLQDFVHSPEHAEAMKKMGEWATPASRTTSWTSPTAEIDWSDARRRLKAAPGYGQTRVARA
jgi:antibiotic biosynthesis monooxygenase (ABM) superfamily enzyme